MFKIKLKCYGKASERGHVIFFSNISHIIVENNQYTIRKSCQQRPFNNL